MPLTSIDYFSPRMGRPRRRHWRWWPIVAIAGGILLAFAGYVVVAFFVPPKVSCRAVATPAGWSLQLDPNYVVNSFIHVRVRQSGTELTSREGPFGQLKGRQVIALPPAAVTGSTVTVECELQYDRVVPSATRVEYQVVLR